MTGERLDRLAEQTWAKLLARIGVPFFVTIVIPIIGWLGLQYVSGIEARAQAQITILAKQLEAINQDRAQRRVENQQVVSKLSDTLNSVSSTMSVIQATATAQYQEVRGRLEELSRRQDRMEDRLNSSVPR